jgi:ferredoxin-NADP reductase
MRLLVQQVTWEAADVVSIRLTGESAELPAWTPGAHLDVVLPSGLIRQYSLCGDPADRASYTVAVLREPDGRGGSAEIHDTALVGRTLEIRGPRNHFELTPAPAYLFVAGGIGITPILAMIRHAAATGADWRLVYGGRTRGSMAFLRELLAIGGDRVTVCPQDETGLLDLPAILASAPDADIYCCGPEGLLRAAQAADPDRTVRIERFGMAEHHEPGIEATGFDVELRRSGLTLAVPAGRRLLDVIKDALPDVAFSCEDGYCGTCETAVLAGVPEHHDDILTVEERERGDSMMICVGRSVSPLLVLDL